MDILPVVIVIIVLALLVIIAGTIKSWKKTPDGSKKGKKIRVKDQGQIMKEANRRLAQNPKDPDALLAIGEVYYSQEAWDKAYKAYEILVELASGSMALDEFLINKLYGLSALRLGKAEEAYKGLILAYTIKPDDFEILHNLGYLEFQKKQYEKAIGFLRSAIKLNMEHAPSLRYMGHALFKTKNNKEALVYLKKALDLQPDDKESLFTMAECFHELGQNEQAIRLFTHLRTDPVLGPSAALFAGTIHINQRQHQKAIMDFELGLKHSNIKPELFIETKYRLAAAYLKEQEIGKAVELLTEIQELSPNYKDSQAQLAKYRELNSSRNLQIYLMAPTSDFITLCRKITLTFFPKAKVKITNISVQKNDWADILAEVETSRWSDTVLLRMIRSSTTVGEIVLRDFHAKIKDVKAGKGYCLTSGIFSDEAKKFVEARLIDLMDKDKLLNLLKTIDSRQKGLLVHD